MSYLGIFLFLVGLIALAIGIVLLVVNRSDGNIKWWMWALAIGGGVLVLLGLAVWIFTRSSPVMAVPVTTTTRRQTQVVS